MDGAEATTAPPQTREHDASVVGMRRLAPAVMSVELQVAGDEPFAYFEGQYIRIHLDDGRRRDLSIANPCSGDGLIEVWVRDVGGDFSRHVFDRLQLGEHWRFEGPLGDAWARDDGRPLLIVSGGTGLGPARAIVRGGLIRDPGRQIELVHGEGERTDLFAHEELDHWDRSHPSFDYVPVLAAPGADWEGAAGTPDRIITERHADLSGWSAHIFGPPPMVEAVIPVLKARGLDDADIHADAFTPGASDLDHEFPPQQ